MVDKKVVNEWINALKEARDRKKHRFESYSSGVWPMDDKWKLLDDEIGLTKAMPKPIEKPLDFETIMSFTATINDLNVVIKALQESIQEE